jgi:hypothetical protein
VIKETGSHERSGFFVFYVPLMWQKQTPSEMRVAFSRPRYKKINLDALNRINACQYVASEAQGCNAMQRNRNREGPPRV